MTKAALLAVRTPVAIGYFAACVAGCKDSVSPTPALGAHYELTSIENRLLPYTWRRIVSSDGIFACDDQITGGRLIFGAGHTATEILDRALKCNDGSPPAVSGDTAVGQYTQSGTQLTIVLQGFLSLEAGSPYETSATVSGDEIQVEKTLSHSAIGTVTDFGSRVFTLVR